MEIPLNLKRKRSNRYYLSVQTLRGQMKKKTGLRPVIMRDTGINTGKIWRNDYDNKPWTKPHKPWINDVSLSDLKGEEKQEMNEEW